MEPHDVAAFVGRRLGRHYVWKRVRLTQKTAALAEEAARVLAVESADADRAAKMVGVPVERLRSWMAQDFGEIRASRPGALQARGRAARWVLQHLDVMIADSKKESKEGTAKFVVGGLSFSSEGEVRAAVSEDATG